MYIRLDVPSKEKDLAESVGARWNPDFATWYIDDISRLQDVSQWIGEYNILCENLYLVKMKHHCWKCGKEIDVVCLATDKSYEVTYGRYKANTDIQLLSYVKKMPKPLSEYWKTLLYTFSYSRTIDDSYYINHCKYCHNIQGDNFLHEVPKQAFYKKLFYRESDPVIYSKVKNSFCVPLLAQLPYYDAVASSRDMILFHMETEIENRASLMVTQKKINGLFACSKRRLDVEIPGL